ncbi:MAG TPA: plastocyanin/azurin family copper-binding protein [Solirubrobacteraceae bacterium]|nr:plastocyanin/azurin family copper-binding protein [Solirubrobacteraceae bacterium]
MSVCAALLAGLLALGVLGATALATPVRSKSHATRSTRRGKCERRARRAAHRARRCRVQRHRKAAGAPKALAPVAAGVAGLGVTVAAPGAEASVPVIAAPLAPVVIAAPPEAEQPAPESPEPEPEPPSIPHVQVNAVEYSFSLSRTSVPAGKVVLEFRNDGQDPHNLNIEPSEGPSEEPVGNTPSQGVDDVNLEMHPGSYTLFCSLPTHEAKGMKATLTVE